MSSVVLDEIFSDTKQQTMKRCIKTFGEGYYARSRCTNDALVNSNYCVHCQAKFLLVPRMERAKARNAERKFSIALVVFIAILVIIAVMINLVDEIVHCLC